MNSSVSAPLLPLHFHYLENRLSVAKQLSEEALNFQIEVGYVFRDSNNATVSLAKKGDIPFSLHELHQLELCAVRSYFEKMQFGNDRLNPFKLTMKQHITLALISKSVLFPCISSQ